MDTLSRFSARQGAAFLLGNLPQLIHHLKHRIGQGCGRRRFNGGAVPFSNGVLGLQTEEASLDRPWSDFLELGCRAYNTSYLLQQCYRMWLLGTAPGGSKDAANGSLPAYRPLDGTGG